VGTDRRDKAGQRKGEDENKEDKEEVRRESSSEGEGAAARQFRF
jgi:hypothetical protein